MSDQISTKKIGGEFGEVRANIDVDKLNKYFEEKVPSVKAPVEVKQFKVSPLNSSHRKKTVTYNYNYSLDRYARSRLTDRSASLNSLSISLYEQSNPTYFLTDSTGHRFVLRKKPAGALLSKTAHQIEREYTILSAIHKHNILPTTAPERRVPVPEPYVLCEDEGVIGTPFYVMEFLDGRIFTDVRMEEVGPQDRREWCVQKFLFVLGTFIRNDSYTHCLLSMRMNDHQRPFLFTFNVAWSTLRHIFATQHCDIPEQ